MTVALTHAGIRLRPAPACEPPFDDEQHPDTWAPPVAQPPLPQLPPPRRAGVPSRPSRPAAPPWPGTSPSTKAAATRFVTTVLEVLNGYRPVAHVRALSRPIEAAAVVGAITDAARRLAREATATRPPRVGLRRMRVCEPAPGTAEISVVIGTDAAPGSRCWAAAFRIEQHRGSWQCTVARVL